MNPLIKFAIWIATISALIGMLFIPNIMGYYRFKEMCEKEGGLRVINPLEKNMGWRVRYECEVCKEKYSYTSGVPITFSEVGFLRLNDEKTGRLVDEFQVPSNKASNKYTYVSTPADLSKAVVYEYRQEYKNVFGSERLRVSSFEVVDLRINKTVVTFKDFSYQWTKYDWGVGGGGCNPVDPKSDSPTSNKIAFRKAFAQ